jgi:hypothetical protein
VLTLSRDTFLPNISEEDHAEGVREQRIFKQWFEANIIKPASNGCSDTIMILPWSSGEPDYRDEHRQPQQFNGNGFFFYNWSPYAEVPEIIVPGK